MIGRFLRGHFGSHQYSADYLLKLNHRFANHTLAGTPNWEWHEQRVALMATNPSMLGARNRLHRLESYIDLEVLSHGFNFLSLFEGLRAEDAPVIRTFFQVLMDLEMAILPNSPEADSDEFQNQYGFDDWLMPVASIYYATLPIADGLSTVAAPIMSLGAGAHHWITDFLKAFFLYAPTLCPTAEDLAARWNALITFAAGSPRWDPEVVKLRYYLEQLYRDLFGMSGHPSYAADKDISKALLLLRRELGEWCERWLKDPDFAAAFARFLSAAEGKEILSFGLIRLAAALPAMQSRRSRHGDLDDALLAEVLPKEMNNMQFSNVLEKWKERVVDQCNGEKKKTLEKQYSLIRYYHDYRNALAHGMWDWDRTSPAKIKTTRIRKKEVISTHFTAADLGAC